ncbi:MAG: hypothetical protein OJI67_18815, partial [Prosthecobacter sp.]|nr:hypothetical protein [Prosthecobacter sp.]
GRGDIVAQSDGNATLTWTASYEAYGKRPAETGTNEDKQRANSKDEDPTGLLNEGFRYRDIETGVWMSRDPAGFVDGPNLYAYVKQNPWTSFDPLGLQVKVTNEQKTNKQGNTYSHTKIEMNVVIVDGSKGRTRLDNKTRTVNQTKRTREELNAIGEDYKNAVEKIWTRDLLNEKGEVVRGIETHVSVTVVTSAKELAEHNDDHIVMIVDDIPDGKAKSVIGRTDRIGGKITAIENEHIEQYERSTSSSQKSSFYITAAHEAGHNFGLFHPYGEGDGKDKSNPLTMPLPHNIMAYENRTEIHPFQIDAIQNNYDLKLLNLEHSGLAPWGPTNIPKYRLP